MKGKYVPERGDIVWLEFSPQVGSEQRGKRPAFVLSLKSYNNKVGLGLFCPITSSIKGYPFEVPLPEGGKISGVILVDQIKNLDWRVRRTAFIQRTAKPLYDEVLAKLITLIG